MVSEKSGPVTFSVRARVLVVAVNELLGNENAKEVKTVINKYVERHMPLAVSGVALDLSGMKKIDSSGIGALIEIGKLFRAQKLPFALFSPPPSMREILEKVNLHKSFPIV